jgi:hypothetical protein
MYFTIIGIVVTGLTGGWIGYKLTSSGFVSKVSTVCNKIKKTVKDCISDKPEIKPITTISKGKGSQYNTIKYAYGDAKNYKPSWKLPKSSPLYDT